MPEIQKKKEREREKGSDLLSTFPRRRKIPESKKLQNPMKTKSDYYWELKQGIDILHAKLRIVIGVRHTMTIHDAAVAILRHTMTHGQGDGEITGGACAGVC